MGRHGATNGRSLESSQASTEAFCSGLNTGFHAELEDSTVSGVSPAAERRGGRSNSGPGLHADGPGGSIQTFPLPFVLILTPPPRPFSSFTPLDFFFIFHYLFSFALIFITHYHSPDIQKHMHTIIFQSITRHLSHFVLFFSL